MLVAPRSWLTATHAQSAFAFPLARARRHDFLPLMRRLPQIAPTRDAGLHLLDDFARLGVSSRCRLRENRLAVDRHFEAASPSFHQCYRFKLIAELRDYLLRQPGGPRSVASLLAI